jgi:hypothetical protein
MLRAGAPIIGIVCCCARRKRPRGRRAADKRDDLAASHGTPYGQSCGMSLPHRLPRVLGVNASLGSCQGRREPREAIASAVYRPCL